MLQGCSRTRDLHGSSIIRNSSAREKDLQCHLHDSPIASSHRWRRKPCKPRKLNKIISKLEWNNQKQSKPYAADERQIQDYLTLRIWCTLCVGEQSFGSCIDLRTKYSPRNPWMKRCAAKKMEAYTKTWVANWSCRNLHFKRNSWSIVIYSSFIWYDSNVWELALNTPVPFWN